MPPAAGLLACLCKCLLYQGPRKTKAGVLEALQEGGNLLNVSFLLAVEQYADGARYWDAECRRLSPAELLVDDDQPYPRVLYRQLQRGRFPRAKFRKVRFTGVDVYHAEPASR